MVKNVFPDIPAYDGMEDEAFPPLPPPQSPRPAGDDGGDPFGNGDEDGETSKLVDVPAAKRKGVKRPQPKLDSNRLTSERGLPALRTLFDDVKFKGKGHEVENLHLLMKKMENWAHRLYPKLQFEDFMDKVEKLGNKKEVQTCLKRIRLDMPLTHEDFMGEDEVPPESNVFGEADPFSRASFHDDDELMMPIHSTPAPAAAWTAPPTPATPSQTAAPPSQAASPPSLTEEQRRRMELNRQRALERRIARQQQQTDPSSSQPTEVKKVQEDEEEEVKKILDDEEMQEEVKAHEEMQEEVNVQEKEEKKKVQEEEEMQDEEMQEVVNVQEVKMQEKEEKKKVQEEEEMQDEEMQEEDVQDEVKVQEEKEVKVQEVEKEVQEEEVQPPSSSIITDQPDQLSLKDSETSETIKPENSCEDED
ncbi:TIMELESS-interacting protein isoform X1 [Scomber scombrus]|uniref:TIMELESS-interacting protein n=1 Tax=Scomber scombrus TaxID=13677 RepID=A0AAV1QBD0_SCOSC